MSTLLNVIARAEVDILAHPFAVIDKYDLPRPSHLDIAKIFDEASKRNIKLEVSGRYKAGNRIMFDFLAENPKFVNFIIFGSDAHSVEELLAMHSMEI